MYYDKAGSQLACAHAHNCARTQLRQCAQLKLPLKGLEFVQEQFMYLSFAMTWLGVGFCMVAWLS